MKKTILVLALAIGGALSASAQSNLGSLLGGLKNLGGSADTEQSGSGSSLGNVVSGVLGGLLSTEKVKPESMVGTWKYTSPAVSFKSENFLQKAGGSAMAGVIEGKLEPYYKTAGLTKLELTVEEDKSFSMKTGFITLKGTIEADGDGQLTFHFQAGKINIGSMTAYVEMTAGRTMSLMFDVTKLVQVIKAVGSVSGSTAIKGISSLLDSYEGICAGFKLAKQ